MKKTLIVLCGTALLLVGLFCFGVVATTTAQAPSKPTINFWNSQRVVNKMLAAKEMDCVDAIKALPGIANASVVVNKRPEWGKATSGHEGRLRLLLLSSKPLTIDRFVLIPLKPSVRLFRRCSVSPTWRKSVSQTGNTAGRITVLAKR